jgi:hypothetical protein
VIRRGRPVVVGAGGGPRGTQPCGWREPLQLSRGLRSCDLNCETCRGVSRDLGVDLL